MARRFVIASCALAAFVAASCSPVPLLQDTSVVRKGKLRAGVGAFMGLPVREAYFEPDGPGVRGSADSNLEFMPLIHAAGWTRYGLGHGLECTTAVHVPTFALVVGVKWAAIAYEPGDVATLALTADVGGSFVIPSFVVGLGAIGSFHLKQDLSLDVTARVGPMTGLWQGSTLTNTIGMSMGGKSTLRLAVGYAMDLGSDLGPSTPAFFVGGGWEQ